MPNVQDCINGLRTTYALVTDAQALTYFNQIHRELIEHAQIQIGSEDVLLVSGQREYTLNGTIKIVSVRSCVYVESASSSREIEAVSTDWLDNIKPGWRNDPEQATPEKFYIEAVETNGEMRIGFFPTPLLGTVAGYPKVIVYGAKFKSLIATDQIPESVPSIRVYIEGMKRLTASDTDVVHFDEYDEAYQQELHRTLASINGTIEDLDSPRIVPVWMKNKKVQ